VDILPFSGGGFASSVREDGAGYAVGGGGDWGVDRVVDGVCVVDGAGDVSGH